MTRAIGMNPFTADDNDNDSITTTRPWQHDWKNPLWHTPLEEDQNDDTAATKRGSDTLHRSSARKEGALIAGERRALDHASALVSPREIIQHLPDWAPGDPDEPLFSQEEATHCVLTATLWGHDDDDLQHHGRSSPSSIATLTTPAVADLILLELLVLSPDSPTTPSSSPSRVGSSPTRRWDGREDRPRPAEVRVTRRQAKWLRWPTSALQPVAVRDEGGASRPFFLPGWGRAPSTAAKATPAPPSSGLLSACWCRLPPPPDAWASAADALDVLLLLSLGLRSPRSSAAGTHTGLSQPQQEWLQQKITTTHATASTDTAAGPPTDLVLVCLSSQGQLFVYNPWTLLQPADPTRRSHHDMDHGMASFLLGSSLLSQVQDMILPLSQPLTTIDLNIPDLHLNKTGPVAIRKMEDDKSAQASPPLASSLYPSPVSVWDLSLWDPTIEAATLLHQTHTNIPTQCIYALEYVCVAGRGIARRRSRHTVLSEDLTGSSEEKPSDRDSSSSSTSSQFSLGGFVTLISLRNYAHVRTLFLPFEPLDLSPFHWGGMSFLMVVGSSSALAIRLDAADLHTVTCGEAPSLFVQHLDRRKARPSGAAQELLSMPTSSSPDIWIHRFQILPIMIPMQSSSSPFWLLGSHLNTSPPCIIHLSLMSEDALLSVTLHTLLAVDLVPQGGRGSADYQKGGHENNVAAVTTLHTSRHTAQLPVSPGRAGLGGQVGQGYCLVSDGLSFICFDGATTDAGAFVKVLLREDSQFIRGHMRNILPLDPFQLVFDQAEREFVPMSIPLPVKSFSLGNAMVEDLDAFPELDDIVVDAIESISSLSYREHVAKISSSQSPRTRTTSFTHREKSERLLRQCSSWTQLDHTATDRQRFHRQMPIITFRTSDASLGSCIISLRQAAVESGDAASFQQILSWLAGKEDYFTAASLALDLLQDGQSLRHLWKAFEKLDDDETTSKLAGLLDGVMQIDHNILSKENLRATTTQLADMTVGCLAKGGLSMSATLEQFLERDPNYDPSRASLMLVATVASALSDDDDLQRSVMGKGYVKGKTHMEDILWPARCLLKAAVARDTLPTALLLLNATIPDELRRRRRSDLASAAPPSIELSRSLVTLIVSSSSDAAEMLLALIDEQSRQPFWQSLQHETRLEYALLKINNVYPFLREPPVRSWAVAELARSLEAHRSMSGAMNELPGAWLQRLCTACLTNARCQASVIESGSFAESYDDSDGDGLARYSGEIKKVRKSLVPSQGSGGLDFDLIIPALLILEMRHDQWNSHSETSTRQLLDGVCYVAGRRSSAEPIFTMDSATLMRQCTLAGDVRAGAMLIGGENGLVLECCHLLIQELSLEMEEAELLVAQGIVPSSLVIDEHVGGDFVLGASHRHLLWLMCEHVLSIRTYGEFESSSSRGKVDPVLAAQACLRTWWFLTRVSLAAASAWLVDWWRRKLEMGNEDVSPFRLACAALTRAVIWPAENQTGMQEEVVLARRLQLPDVFLLQLAQSCCGLVEALPSTVAQEAWKIFEATASSTEHQKDLSRSSRSVRVTPKRQYSSDDSVLSTTPAAIPMDV